MIIIGAIWPCFCINTTMSLPQLVPGSPLHSVGTDYQGIAGPAASNERPFAPETSLLWEVQQLCSAWHKARVLVMMWFQRSAISSAIRPRSTSQKFFNARK